MPETPDLDYIRAELDRELDEFDVDFPEPLPTDKYVAVSALQKAIRRGDVRTAHRATATVHLLDRRSFWRRTLVTAFEDIGIGDLVAVTQTAAAAERAGDSEEALPAARTITTETPSDTPERGPIETKPKTVTKPPAAASTGGTTTSRLLEAKRRAQANKKK